MVWTVVHCGWTIVHVAATNGSCVRRRWTFVYQLETAAAVRPVKTDVAAAKTPAAGLHNKLTIISVSAICTKIFKKIFYFCLFCELTFLKICDIIFIEKIKKGLGDVYG